MGERAALGWCLPGGWENASPHSVRGGLGASPPESMVRSECTGEDSPAADEEEEVVVVVVAEVGVMVAAEVAEVLARQ
jgi:hypothetical protein